MEYAGYIKWVFVNIFNATFTIVFNFCFWGNTYAQACGEFIAKDLRPVNTTSEEHAQQDTSIKPETTHGIAQVEMVSSLYIKIASFVSKGVQLITTHTVNFGNFGFLRKDLCHGWMKKAFYFSVTLCLL